MRAQTHDPTAIAIRRRSGVALWRQIADAIRAGLTGEFASANGRLPAEHDLAARFGVNRHTVRAAIAALVQEGVLRSEQGRGTFVVQHRRLSYPIARRTRFSAGFGAQSRSRVSRLVATAREPANPHIAAALGLSEGAMLIRLDTLGEVDGMCVSRAASWFDAARFDGLGEVYARTGSMTAALAELGVSDYLRHSTLIEARHAEAGDLEELRLSAGAIVLITRAVNTDIQGRPIQYSQTRFSADRVELLVDYSADADEKFSA